MAVVEVGNIEAAAVVRLVMLLDPGCVNELAIKEAFGDTSVESLSEVAQAFGVAAATVRHTWRRDGMPGDAKAKCWPLGEILIWFLKRKLANAVARGSDELTKLKKEAETRIAEAEARIKERKAEVTEGEFVPLAAVQATLRGMLNVFRDTMLNIPRQLTPMFPAKYASQWTEEVDRLIRNCLTIVADKPIEDFMQQEQTADE